MARQSDLFHAERAPVAVETAARAVPAGWCQRCGGRGVPVAGAVCFFSDADLVAHLEAEHAARLAQRRKG